MITQETERIARELEKDWDEGFLEYKRKRVDSLDSALDFEELEMFALELLEDLAGIKEAVERRGLYGRDGSCS